MYRLQGIIGFVGRLALSAIFLMSAVGNKIPNFDQTVDMMSAEGVPQPRIMLMGAIAFLVVGALSVTLGVKARFGALLLLIFLALATYYFHDFWNVIEEAKQMQMISFMKNLALMGAMLVIISNGAGNGSLDQAVEIMDASDAAE